MVNKAVGFKLDESVSSPQDLKSMIMEIQLYARWFAHNEIKKRAGVKSRKISDEPALSPAAAHTLSQADKPLSTKSLDALIATLEGYAANAPEITITLAAPPPGALKRQLVAWCRNNISPGILINFQFSSAILGGMTVRIGSRVFDWSFRHQILDNAAKFPETLRRV